MTGKIKALFVLLLLAAISLVMYNSVDIKDRSIRELYEEVTFMRITIEARQYINQIEYGIKNGRQLDNFYNMQETLKGVQGCSSYMEGAYVVSAEAKLLYQSGLKADELNLKIPQQQTASGDELYYTVVDAGHFQLITPIKNGSGQTEGYLIMCIAKNAVSNAVSDYNRQNRVQSVIIALEVFGIALLIIKRVRPGRKRKLVFRLVLVLSIAVTFSAVLDSGMVFARFYQIVDDTARQAANKMAQALQSDVDSVIAKGVSPERIYDLNGWLAHNSSELTIVNSLTLDRNNKVTANVSQIYINSFFNRLLMRTALLIFICALCSLAACGLAALPCRMEAGGRFNKTVGGKGAVHA